MDEGIKPCRKCGLSRPHSDFNRKAASPDGLQPACRQCVSEYNHELYLRDPAKVRAKNDAWAAANADRVRELARERMARNWAARPEESRAYQRSWYKANAEGRRRSIRECARRRRAADPQAVRDYLRLWRELNREKVSAMNRKRRARKASVLSLPFTPIQLAQRLSMWPGCWMCGGPKETVDHVKPLSRGGAHILANFRPACWSCNSSKRDSWPFVLRAA